MINIQAAAVLADRKFGLLECLAFGSTGWRLESHSTPFSLLLHTDKFFDCSLIMRSSAIPSQVLLLFTSIAKLISLNALASLAYWL